MPIRRRVLLRSLGAVGVGALAGCLGGTKQEGESNELSAKESLTDDFDRNHLHGLAYDHTTEQLYLATHHGLFVLKNDEDLFLVGDSSDDFMGFTMHPERPDILYRSGHPSGGGNLGVERSEDGGFTWTRIFTGLDDETVDFHMMTISDADPEVLFGGYHGKLYVTEDAGKTWRIATSNGLSGQGLCWGVPCLAPDSGERTTVLAGTQEGLFVSTDLGEAWQRHTPKPVAGITVHPTDASILYGFTHEGIVQSTDRADTWQVVQPATEFGGNESAFGFAVNHAAPDKVYAGTTVNRVLRTTDAGETWEVILP